MFPNNTDILQSGHLFGHVDISCNLLHRYLGRQTARDVLWTWSTIVFLTLVLLLMNIVECNLQRTHAF